MAIKYKYIAVSLNGDRITGTVEANDELSAKDIIDSKGLIPVSVKRYERKFDSLRRMTNKSVAHENLIFLTRKLLTLSRAGIPILRSLQIIIDDTADQKLNSILSDVRKSIEGGDSLAESFENHEGYFPSIYIEAIKAGEESGTLDTMLERTMELLEREAKIKESIKTAVRYPAYVLITMALAFFVIITLVVPKFAGLYSTYGAELPWATKLVININSFIGSYWPILLVVLPLLVWTLWRARYTEWGTIVYDRISISTPIISPIYIKAAMSRLCFTLSILLSAGLPLSRALSILKDSIGNYYFSKVINKMGENLSGGLNLALPMKESKYFSPLVVQMFSLGLESGSLESLLRETAGHFDGEIEYDTKKLTSRIEPVLTVLIAAMVLVLALAIFTPMWNLIEVFKR
ncbi:MAG: type II secretion system F family protein [candidate division Zixibacteria bacterium]